jgi:hypothetical protein
MGHSMNLDHTQNGTEIKFVYLARVPKCREITATGVSAGGFYHKDYCEGKKKLKTHPRKKKRLKISLVSSIIFIKKV